MIKYYWQLRDVSNNNTNNNTRKKIDLVTKCCRSFINNLLKDLSNKNPENANIIYEYIIAEQIEFNIKDTTKIGKIKALVSLILSLEKKVY